MEYSMVNSRKEHNACCGQQQQQRQQQCDLVSTEYSYVQTSVFTMSKHRNKCRLKIFDNSESTRLHSWEPNETSKMGPVGGWASWTCPLVLGAIQYFRCASRRGPQNPLPNMTCELNIKMGPAQRKWALKPILVASKLKFLVFLAVVWACFMRCIASVNRLDPSGGWACIW